MPDTHHRRPIPKELLMLSSKATMEERFQWLTEMQNFIHAAISPEKWKRWREIESTRETPE